jgi:Superinfection immunity protein
MAMFTPAMEAGLTNHAVGNRRDAEYNEPRIEKARWRWGEPSMAAILLIVGLLIYFAPAIVGRNKRNNTAIFVLNLFLGWTVIGWVVAFVWAVMKEDKSSAL